MKYDKIVSCRFCEGSVKQVLHIGNHPYSGVFLSKKIDVPSGPLSLVMCDDCNLIQLSVNYNLDQMYGENYGYRSGLNITMVNHLRKTKDKILNIIGISLVYIISLFVVYGSLYNFLN